MNKTRNKLKARKTRVVAYCRVSTDNADQKQSFEAQKDYYTHKFRAEGYTVAPTGLLHRKKGSDKVIEGIYADEGISATSTKNRVAFLKMIEDAKNGLFDMIFVKSVSRFSRNVADGVNYCDELRKYNVAVFFEDYGISSISEDKDFELALFFSLAQKESQTKSNNVKWGIRQSQLKGTWVTQASYGYDKVGKNLVINEKEAEIVKEIFNIYLNEGWGLAKIAKYLQNRNIPTKRNATWNMTRINEILSNPVYKGILRVHTIENRTIKDKTDKKIIPEDEHIVSEREDLRVVSDEIWEKANEQKRMRSNMMKKGHKPSRKYKYSSFLYCYNCGSAYRAKKIWRHKQKPKKYKNDEIPLEYCCSTRDQYGKDTICTCNKRIAIREHRITQIIKTKITELQKDKSHLEELFLVYTLITRGFPLSEEELQGLYTRRDEINSEMRGVLKRLAVSDSDIYDNLLDELEDDLKNINTQIIRAETRELAVKSDYDKYKKYIDLIDSIDPENITRLELQELFSKVEVLSMEQDFGWENEAVGLVFEYNFLGMPQMELVDKALQLGYPKTIELEVILI